MFVIGQFCWVFPREMRYERFSVYLKRRALNVKPTASDSAGNTDTVDITFPAVAKGEQTLSGFEYSAASITFGSTAPTGAQTALGYTASPETVCTVDATSGKLTIIEAGTCVITATAEATDDYNAATARFTLTVQNPATAVTLIVSPATVTEHGGAETGASLEVGGLGYAAGNLTVEVNAPARRARRHRERGMGLPRFARLPPGPGRTRVDAAVAAGTRDVAASMAYPYDRGQGWMECPGDGGHRRASK